MATWRKNAGGCNVAQRGAGATTCNVADGYVSQEIKARQEEARQSKAKKRFTGAKNGLRACVWAGVKMQLFSLYILSYIFILLFYSIVI